jgi:hypothetical protein
MGRLLLAQNIPVESSHRLSGAEVAGFTIELPFTKALTEAGWKNYAKSFGRSDNMQGHSAYETVFNPAIYNNKTLIFVAIAGSEQQSNIWAAIDAQGIPKDVYPELKAALKSYIFDFYIKMRVDAAQKQIDDSEKVASLLSKTYEEFKREERKNLREQEKNQLKIEKYEQELVQMRIDSANYISTVESLSFKLDSVNIEVEKIKNLVSTYKEKLKEIE